MQGPSAANGNELRTGIITKPCSFTQRKGYRNNKNQEGMMTLEYSWNEKWLSDVFCDKQCNKVRVKK
jgi:hypothetical protein